MKKEKQTTHSVRIKDTGIYAHLTINPRTKEPEVTLGLSGSELTITGIEGVESFRNQSIAIGSALTDLIKTWHEIKDQ